jgi:hypothetical protein
MLPDAEAHFPADNELLRLFHGSSVTASRLPRLEHKRWELAWREVYQTAFVTGRRFRCGAKADHAFLQEPCSHWLIVPFLSMVPGTAVNVQHKALSAFECHGPLLLLEAFKNIEFFISPPDLSWTFVRTHEDYALGGPYFARAQ